MAQSQSGTSQLIAWLDDAHAMESGLVGILQNHAAHFAGRMPAAAARLQEHIIETRQHAERVRRCLQFLNASPSTVKSTLSSVIGSVEGAATAIFRDELVKDTLADYASEQLEVGCYTALITAAMQLGYVDIAQLCQRNLDEDQAMAAWLLQQIPVVVARDAVDRATGAPAR